MVCRETKSNCMFQPEPKKTGRSHLLWKWVWKLRSCYQKCTVYEKKHKQNSSKNWEIANNKGLQTTGCFWALRRALPPHTATREQHIRHKQNLGSAMVFSQIKNNHTSHQRLENSGRSLYRQVPKSRKVPGQGKVTQFLGNPLREMHPEILLR